MNIQWKEISTQKNSEEKTLGNELLQDLDKLVNGKLSLGAGEINFGCKIIY